jgi:hypothetical protein
MFWIFDKLPPTRFAFVFLFARVDAAIFHNRFTTASWTFHPSILPHLSLLVVDYHIFKRMAVVITPVIHGASRMSDMAAFMFALPSFAHQFADLASNDSDNH